MPRFAVPDKGLMNGVELFAISVTSEVRTINPQGTSVPDHAWTFTDPSGHFHAYAADGALPTLQRRTSSCAALDQHEDGEGDDCACGDIWFACVICGDEVKPRRRRADMFEPHVIVGTDYTAHVEGPVRLAEQAERQVTLQVGRLFTVGRFALRDFTTDSMRGEVSFRQWHMRRGGQELREQRRPIDLEAAIAAAATALDPRGVDFSVLVARTAVEAALPHLGVSASGEPLP